MLVYFSFCLIIFWLIAHWHRNYLCVKRYSYLRRKTTQIIDQYPQCNLYINETTGEIYPIEIIWEKTGARTTFLIQDSHEQYILPKPLRDNQQTILETIFSASIIYNQLCIRLYDLKHRDNTVLLRTQRTMYYDSLVTNRNMDYLLNSDLSIRMMYEPGPALSPLSESFLSNQIGFSGIIESEDGVILLVQRSKYVSTNQQLFDCSVTASLKSQYALNQDSKSFTCENWVKAIEREIIDELNLDSSITINFTTNDIIAFYRDLIEGGKPNFIFYLRINSDFITLRKGLESAQRNNTNLVLQDGFRFRGIYRKDFIDADITVAKVTVNTVCSNSCSKKKRESLFVSPQSSGVLQYIQKYLRGQEN